MWRRVGRKRLPVRVQSENPTERLGDIASLEHALACQHLEEHHTKRPDIGTLINGSSPCLLR